MSRSRKKTAGFTDTNKWARTYASRQFRRISPEKFDFADGRSFKKYTCSYNICDWSSLAYTKVEVEDWVMKYDYKLYELYIK